MKKLGISFLIGILFLSFCVKSVSSANYQVNINSGNVITSNKLSLGTQLTTGRLVSFPDNTVQKTLAREANIKMIRFFDYPDKIRPCDSWNNGAKTCNNWDWSKVDKLVESIYEVGAEPLVNLLHWSTSLNGFRVVPGMTRDATGLADKQQFAAYARAWVQHFKNKGYPVKYFELVNEVQFYITSGGWDNIIPDRRDRFMELYRVSRDAMLNENSNLIISFDFVTYKKLFDYWLNNGGAEVDSLNFHKYDSYRLDQYTDQQLFDRAESQYYGQWPLGRSVTDSQRVYRDRRGRTLPIINSESNMNSVYTPHTSQRIIKMTGATWLALMLRQGILEGMDYNIFFTWASSLNYEIGKGGYGFGMVNTDNNQPLYPYFVHKMIGPNLAVGDSIVDSTSSSNNLRTLSWFNNGNLNILLIHKSSGTNTVSLQGVSGQLNYQKIDDPNDSTFLDPSLKSGTINAGDSITLNGYSVILLQKLGVGSTSTSYDPNYPKVIGTLVDNYYNPIQAGIIANSVYDETDQYGNYELSVQSGTYDIQYNIWNFFISNFYIKIPSINVYSDIYNLVNYITQYAAENKLSFVADVNYGQIIETHSPLKPTRVLIDGQIGTEVYSTYDLTEGTWYYQSPDILQIKTGYAIGATTSTTIPFSDLVGYWKFDEGYGSTAYDESGLENHASIDGATWAVGASGSALRFDGYNDYLEVSDQGYYSLDLDSQVTITAWINPSSIRNWDRIVAKSHDSPTFPYTMYGLLFDNTGHLRMEIATGNQQNAVNGYIPISTNQWTHVTGTYDSNEIKIYVNGELDNTQYYNGWIDTNNMPLSIGRSGFGANYFFGMIDEVKIYNRALSPDEIRRDYESITSITESDYIHTEGNKIMKNGREFIFRGATLWDGYVASTLPFDENNYHTLFQGLKSLNLNTIRLYMNWVRFVREPQFRENLHKILAIADQYDMNVIYVAGKVISDNWSHNNVWFYPPYVHSELNDVIPNRDALIPNYASKWLEFDEENFFLEFYNEPMLDDGTGVRKGDEVERYFRRRDSDALTNQDIWAEDCQNMITYLRSNGFKAPIIIHWGYGTLSPMWTDDPLWNMNWYKRQSFTGSNLIYSQGNYRYHGAVGRDISDRNARPTDKQSILTSLEDHGILYAKERDPVLIYECGAADSIRDTDNIWLNNLLSIFNEKGISWIVHAYRYPADIPWGFRGTSTEQVVKTRASDPQP